MRENMVKNLIMVKEIIIIKYIHKYGFVKKF